MNDKPIFIVGAHKSGTTLLRNILDGHSFLYTIPVESHFFQHMNCWIDNEYRQQRPKNKDIKNIRKNFCNFIHERNKNENKYGGSFSKDLFDEKLFQDQFNNINDINNYKEIMIKYFQTIYYSINKEKLPEKIRIVEKSVENAEFAIELFNFFPNAQFIHIIRNPYANFVSLRKYKSFKFGYPIIRRMIKTLYNNYYFLYKNQKIIDNYHVLRYEDLVLDPESIIKNICVFLKIPFEQILLTPTYRGQSWQGNSMTDKKLHGISSERLGKWRKEIYPMEIEYINHLFNFVLNDYNYKKIFPIGSFWKPIKGENLKRYLANRLYRYYLQEW